MNAGISAFGKGFERVDAWSALGYGFEPFDRVSVNLGVGYARTLRHRDGGDGSSTDDRRDRVSIGSVATDGVLPRPLLEYRVADGLSFGLSAQLDYLLPGGDLGYQTTLSWTWRFGVLDMMVKP